MVEANFDSYPLATMTDMPAIEVHIAPSGEAAGGIGEPATPPVAPALGNAIFAATGKRIRTLPIGEIDLTHSRRFPARRARDISARRREHLSRGGARSDRGRHRPADPTAAPTRHWGVVPIALSSADHGGCCSDYSDLGRSVAWRTSLACGTRATPLAGPSESPILAARLNSARFIFRETSKTRAGRAGNLDKSSAS